MKVADHFKQISRSKDLSRLLKSGVDSSSFNFYSLTTLTAINFSDPTSHKVSLYTLLWAFLKGATLLYPAEKLEAERFKFQSLYTLLFGEDEAHSLLAGSRRRLVAKIVYLFDNVLQQKLRDIGKIFAQIVKDKTGLEMDIFDIFQDIVEEKSIQDALGFTFALLLNKLELNMNLYFYDKTNNKDREKRVLYDCRIAGKDVDYTLIMIKDFEGYLLSFGVNDQLWLKKESQQPLSTKSSYYNDLKSVKYVTKDDYLGSLEVISEKSSIKEEDSTVDLQLTHNVPQSPFASPTPSKSHISTSNLDLSISSYNNESKAKLNIWDLSSYQESRLAAPIYNFDDSENFLILSTLLRKIDDNTRLLIQNK